MDEKKKEAPKKTMREIWNLATRREFAYDENGWTMYDCYGEFNAYLGSALRKNFDDKFKDEIEKK